MTGLSLLAILPQYRKSRLSTFIMKRAEELAFKELDSQKIIIDVNNENKTLKRYYKIIGYKETNKLLYSSNWSKEYKIFEKTLGN